MNLLTVTEFVERVHVGRSSTYRGIGTGEIPSVRVLGRVLIPESYVDALLSEAVNRESAGNGAPSTLPITAMNGGGREQEE